MKYKPHNKMKRIFIAVKINADDTLITMMSDLKAGLKEEKIKWTDSENLHITLAFLGDTEEDMIKPVNKMLKRICEGFGEFEIIIKGAGVFKNLKDPRVIWTGIEPSEKLKTLYESIKPGLKDAGIILEERTFNPHLTLGRIKSIKDMDVLKSLISGYADCQIQKQAVSEVILYESQLFHSGPVYKPLGKFALAEK